MILKKSFLSYLDDDPEVNGVFSCSRSSMLQLCTGFLFTPRQEKTHTVLKHVPDLTSVPSSRICWCHGWWNTSERTCFKFPCTGCFHSPQTVVPGAYWLVTKIQFCLWRILRFEAWGSPQTSASSNTCLLPVNTFLLSFSFCHRTSTSPCLYKPYSQS